LGLFFLARPTPQAAKADLRERLDPVIGEDDQSSVCIDVIEDRPQDLVERLRLQFISEAFNALNHGNITTARTTEFRVSSLPVLCGIAKAPCSAGRNTGPFAFGTPTTTCTSPKFS
jgi:hypothetical protein